MRGGLRHGLERVTLVEDAARVEFPGRLLDLLRGLSFDLVLRSAPLLGGGRSYFFA